MTEPNRSDYFGTFLQEFERESEAAPSSSLGLLQSVVEHEGMGVRDLQTLLRRDFTSFTEDLRRLVDAGYVEVTGSPGEEQARATDQGKTAATLASS